MKYKVGVIGAGNMAMAIMEGAVKSNLYKKDEIVLFNRTEEKRAQKESQGYAVCDNYIDVYKNSDIVLIAVKPQNFEEIMPVLKAVNNHKPLVISIAAGISMAYMEQYLGTDCPMVRVMPNTPLMISCGASAIAKNNICSNEQLNVVHQIFEALGVVTVFNDENLINDVIPVNGSSPAYVYYFIDAMAKNAEKHGIDKKEALKLICQTFMGSAKMVMESGKTPEELIKQVCSPGGTTLAAIHVMNQNNLGTIIDEASDACIKRAYELGK